MNHDLCAWCQWPMKGPTVTWNGTTGHPRCVAAARLDGRDIGTLEHRARVADLFTQIGEQAQRLGISRARLSLAINRALEA